MKRLTKFISICVIVLLLAGCASSNISVVEEVKGPSPVDLNFNIRFCGDLMTHSTQIDNAKKSDGTYSFAEYFPYVQTYLEDADLCAVNFETTTPCTGQYSGYPAFKAPEILASEIKEVGIDLAITSNNHMNDSGLKGAKATLDVLHKAGLETAGSRYSDQESRASIIPVSVTDKDGEERIVTVGIVAYTYETSIINGHRCINGVQLNDEQLTCYNSYQSYDGDEKLNQSLEEIKHWVEYSQMNADITIVYMHWGEEYQLKANAQQQYVAKYLAALKPDAIIGSHSHTVQNIDMIDGVPVFYSLGNFISNQRQETLDNRYTEETIIANVSFNLHKDDKSQAGWDISLAEVNAIPCWVDRYKSEGKIKYAIIPLVGDYKNNDALKISGHASRAEQGLKDITELIGENYLWNLK